MEGVFLKWLRTVQSLLCLTALNGTSYPDPRSCLIAGRRTIVFLIMASYTFQSIIRSRLRIRIQEPGAHTNTIEDMWGQIKREFRRKCHRQSGTTKDIFDSYFSEFIWRRRYTDKNSDIIFEFIDAIKNMFVPLSADKPPSEE